MSTKEFIAMGGYAPYVWGVYIIAALILVANVVQPFVRRRDVLSRLREHYRLKNRTP